MIKTFLFMISFLIGVLTFLSPKHPEKVNNSAEKMVATNQNLSAKRVLSPSTTQQLIDSIIAFKATLTSAQLASVQREYSLANAKVWSNLPAQLSARIGLRMADLTATQVAAAMACVKIASGTTANEGYAEIQQLLGADDYLLANGGGSAYGSGQYYLNFFGTPSLTGTWEFQFGGHHMTLANTYINGSLVGATPAFRGVEPFAAFTYNGASVQPMVQDRDSFVTMLAGLTATQLASAKLSSTFSDLVLAPGKDWQFPTTRQGLQCNTLSSAQKALVLAAIKTYVYDIDNQSAATIMAKYTNELDQTYVAYSGNASLLAQNDYVRIDGPSVWIEYNTQGGIIFRNVPHPHSVWRDRSGDYGGTGNPTAVQALPSVVAGIKNYPNPATQSINIDINLTNNAEISILIFDLNGKLIQNAFQGSLSEGQHVLPVNVSTLSSGSYIYTVKSNEKGVIRTLSKQMIKM